MQPSTKPAIDTLLPLQPHKAEYFLDWAAERGYFKASKRLCEKRKEGYAQNAMDLAATHGPLEALKWLRSNPIERPLLSGS